MKQRKNNESIDLLNHVTAAELDDHTFVLKSEFAGPSDNCPKRSLHVFEENAPANTHKETMLSLKKNEL